MAKVKIQGNASGTGVLTVTAPNTSTDRTITLPDTTGELLSTAGGTMTGNISHASNLTLDVGGDLYLDSDGGNWRFNDGGTDIGLLKNNSSDFQIEAKVQDKDIKFVGNDGGSAVTALTLDMSDAGKAIFNSGLAIGGTGAANTLDDYEEGTFTPSFKNVNISSYEYQVGRYTKIGNRVFFQLDIETTAMDNNDTSAVSIQGLPFNIPVTTNAQPFTVAPVKGTNIAHPMMIGQTQQDYMLMYKYSASTGDTGDWAAYQNLGTTVRIYVEGHYQI